MYLQIISRKNTNISQFYSGYIVGQECNNHRKLFALWQNGEGRCDGMASGLRSFWTATALAGLTYTDQSDPWAGRQFQDTIGLPCLTDSRPQTGPSRRTT